MAAKLDNNDWEKIGYDIPLLVNLQPAGEYPGEEYHRAGGVTIITEVAMRNKRVRVNSFAKTIDAGPLSFFIVLQQSTSKTFSQKPSLT